MVQEHIKNTILHHRLPAHFEQFVSTWYVPIAHDIAQRVSKSKPANQNRTFFVGIQGTQGSGKSTMAEFIGLLLTHQHGLRVAILSLDDFYHTRETRQELSHSVHALLNTRGVPGTHDVPLALSTLKMLRELQEEQEGKLPKFDKAIDDRAPIDEWTQIKGPVDVVIFEGWCVGATAQPDQALTTPTNELERTEDEGGKWRKFVNDQLDHDYRRLFDHLDCLATLTAPSFDCVFNWRTLQEQKLKDKVAANPDMQGTAIMDSAQIKRFISHYERLTTHCLKTLPEKADWVIELDESHNITNVIFN